MSGASMVSIDVMARIDPANTWFQLYAANDPKFPTISFAVPVMPASATLMLTSTLRCCPKRERDMRNGFRLPPKLAPLDLLEALASGPG